MQECNSLPLSAQPWLIVDESQAGIAAFLERAVEVIYGKADVVDSGSAPFQELSDGRIGLVGFEKLDQGLASQEAADPGPVAVSQLGLGHSEDIAIE